ncbi:MAG: nicotinate-nucleotide--dimethylbenzimidazole phosphoribosyltransferase, partial [Alphaproteobacteria bacterium]|nr:nicotinate-nucleotide--dimethylbenzimidazole phosphoribosyltransferase [Alphaproteobacteria bacterium]
MARPQHPDTLAAFGRLIADMPLVDAEATEKARAREAVLTKPAGALGRLEDLAEWLAGWQGRHPGDVERVLVAVFAGNHGVAAQGVSAYPADVTVQM